MKGKLIVLDENGHTEIGYDEREYDYAAKAFADAIRNGMTGIKTKDGVSSTTKVFDPDAETHETIVPLVGG